MRFRGLGVGGGRFVGTHAQDLHSLSFLPVCASADAEIAPRDQADEPARRAIEDRSTPNVRGGHAIGQPTGQLIGIANEDLPLLPSPPNLSSLRQPSRVHRSTSERDTMPTRVMIRIIV